MTQTKSELETFYKEPDPWGYKRLECDRERKQTILRTLAKYGPYERALDVACGEGWVTGDIPAEVVCGYELSDAAAKRFPLHVFRVRRLDDVGPLGTVKPFDLVLCTGALYPEYDYETLLDIINRCSSKYIVTCSIADKEIPDLRKRIVGELVETLGFKYERPERSYMQTLKVFKK